MKAFCHLLFALCTAVICVPVFAQNFPEKPITLIVPYSAGGSTDVAMRALADAASKHLGQRVIVENRTGVGGTLGPATMVNADDKCEMYFSQGQVKHAAYGSITGDEAVFKVLRWTDGSFQVDFDGKTAKESTTLNTQGLLMEGLRQLDEAQRDSTEGEDVLLDT